MPYNLLLHEKYESKEHHLFQRTNTPLGNTFVQMHHRLIYFRDGIIRFFYVFFFTLRKRKIKNVRKKKRKKIKKM